MSSEIIIGVLTLLGTMATAYLAFLSGKRNQANQEKQTALEANKVKLQGIETESTVFREEFNDLYNRVKGERDLLNGQVDSLRDELNTIRTSLQNDTKQESIFLAKLSMIQSTHREIPIPEWTKTVGNKKFLMASLNDAFESFFLVPQGLTRVDTISQTDVEIWGGQIGEALRAIDMEVMNRKRFIITKNPLIYDESGIPDDWLFLRYPIWNEGLTNVIGIGGLAIPVNLVEDI